MKISSLSRYSTGIRSKNRKIRDYLDRQLNDEFAKLAREHSYRARSAFKLLEIQNRWKIFEKGNTVLDVGAAPGSWSQVAYDCVQPTGYVLGVDLQPLKPLDGVEFLSKADIQNPSVQKAIIKRLGDRPVDCLISDMAPSPTGSRTADHERIIDLCETVVDLIRPENESKLKISDKFVFLCKIWDGHRKIEFTKKLEKLFDNVRCIKPEASRSDSAEIFVLARRNK
ncbi:unnamed protein product [Bursaphelenchus xylophilus]|uniref:rRNA methyltransferase 2, mitochondrial n=1 Tax=Bursaphelenchus xylophilus TaxID=6326 RepID=A0A1I7RLM2_BURXY|nr:unnamed protein product [Bursaphelenchus xylophilus]CAG9082829.1 unnamed protein product [Bursaphelenchus xylophilus]